MPELVIIAGQPVPVPPEVVSEGRDAVAAWMAKQPGAQKPAPVPPPEVQRMGDRAVVEWYVEQGHPVEHFAEIKAELDKRKADQAAAAAKAGGAPAALRKTGAAPRQGE